MLDFCYTLPLKDWMQVWLQAACNYAEVCSFAHESSREPFAYLRNQGFFTLFKKAAMYLSLHKTIPVFVIACCFGAAAAAQAPAPASTPAREWITPATGNVQQGAALYQTHCTACHAIDSHKIGPAHRRVVGRRLGSLPGYTYSAELAQSRLRWTPQTLNAWLEDPEALVPGQRMGFAIESAQDRADLIAYLASLR